ncbi:MAG: phenylalanine--tRNA ligase subunit beta [Patescibacteria group bacterium]|jgi:phenylalanyl-tRNA synthetase beta chain
MNIKITYNWLLDYLDTDATPDEIRQYLSLCGPSVESVEKIGNDYVFDIEITSNRIDTASVIGIAQEAQAILPMFGKKAVLKLNPLTNLKFAQIKEGSGYDLKVDIQNPNLVSRFTALIFDQITIKDSPQFIKDRLIYAGVKVINSVVDISNYLMITLGQPIHMFDYDKIADKKMIVRESKKGEKLITLDEKEITLPGGDVVIEDGSGKLIDLCGIMGGLNSAITSKTKRVLLFVQTYNKSKIRRTTMSTGQRTIAATFFEKGLDEERVEATTVIASQLLQKYCGGVVVSKIQDIYPKKSPKKVINVKYELIDKLIGVKIDKKIIKSILTNLGFIVETGHAPSVHHLQITVPSFRINDISIPEDIVEEVARVYGYQNVPSVLQPIVYIDQPKAMEDIFVFQNKIKLFLKHLGLNEVINYSMISKDQITDFGLDPAKHLRLSNTLSKDIEYLRTSLPVSLFKNIKENSGKKDTLRLFEIAKVYIKDGPSISTVVNKINKVRPSLPNEIYRLAIATNTDYYDLKGIVEAIYKELNIDEIAFAKATAIKEKDGVFMVELDFQKLIDNCQLVLKYKPLHPYAIIKLDKTFEISPDNTYGAIYKSAEKSKLLQRIEVVTLYQNKLTLRFYYSSPDRNITEEEAKMELNHT